MSAWQPSMYSIRKATAHRQPCNLSGMAVEVATAAEVAMAVTVVEAVVTGAAVTVVTVALVLELAALGGGAAAAVAAAVPEAIGAGATVIGSGALIRASPGLACSTCSASHVECE